MKRIVFEDDEMRVISMFDTSSRETVITAIESVIPFTRDDGELSEVVINTVEKLKRINDKDFRKLDFETYRMDAEEDDE